MSRTFASASDHLDFGSALLTAPPFTIACWVKRSVLDSLTEHWITLGTAGSGDNRFTLGTPGTTGTIFAAERDTVSSFPVTTAGISDTTTWHHATGMWADHTNRAVFLDGGNKATIAVLKTASAADMFRVSGDPQATPATPFRGQMAHVAIWNVVLTDDEVAMLGLNKVSPLLVRPQSLVCYHPFIGRDTADIDIIGGRTLTTTGATASDDEPPALWLPRRRRLYVLPSTVAGLTSMIATIYRNRP